MDNYSPDTIIAALSDRSHQTTSDTAQVTLSTVHKAKGLEWSQVAMGTDFSPIDLNNSAPESLRLRYVAVTRAKQTLDPGSLALDQLVTNANVQTQSALIY